SIHNVVKLPPQVFTLTTIRRHFPFSWDCNFLRLHKQLSYGEFTQFLLVGFILVISGTCAALDFRDIMVNSRLHMLTPFAEDSLVAVGGSTSHQLISTLAGAALGELGSSCDYFKKVKRNEGFFGLVPQLLGVAPEKAIKLTVRHCVRKCTDTCLLITFVLADGCAGSSQVNSLEILLQVVGEISKGQRVCALSVTGDLGFSGLYKVGQRAPRLIYCRTSPSYFPCNAHTKAYLTEEDGRIGLAKMLFGGALAGMLAAFLVTPADVIITRLQVVARAGQTTYSGLVDLMMIIKLLSEECPFLLLLYHSSPFSRVSTLFNSLTVPLASFLLLAFSYSPHHRKPAGSEPTPKSRISLLAPNPDHIGGFRLAVAMFAGIRSKFGLHLPRYMVATTVRTPASSP
uniref:Solute carrier family 25 member 13 n=1 Tax=Anabas testudineus TaxID=64144 RepID=A0AAQ6IGL4_ANATE